MNHRWNFENNGRSYAAALDGAIPGQTASVGDRTMKRWLIQNRGFLLFLLCLGLARTAVADWNPIPSGSMRPTLLEGDVVLVDRLAYNLKMPLTDVVLARLGEPIRGDVVTFSSPTDGTRLIKRVVGLPGDWVAMRGGRLIVNGQAIDATASELVWEPLGAGQTPAIRARERLDAKEHAVQFLPLRDSLRDFGPVSVPRDHFFFLGDNRDDSGDSRYFGPVPRSRLIGRAHHVLVSADILGTWRPRIGRFGAPIE